MIETPGIILKSQVIIPCDGGCNTVHEHAVDHEPLNDAAAYAALRAGHQVARAAAIEAGWQPGPDGILLCKACPSPTSFGIPDARQLAADLDAAITAILAPEAVTA